MQQSQKIYFDGYYYRQRKDKELLAMAIDKLSENIEKLITAIEKLNNKEKE